MSARRSLVFGAIAFSAVASCSHKDGSVTDSAGGIVAIDSTTGDVVFRDVKYPLTSDNFKKFSLAQDALDALPQPQVVQRIDVRNPREDDVLLVVKQLEDDDAARRAIETAEMSVRDFVLTSLALGQALAFSTDLAAPVNDVNRAFLVDNRSRIDQVEARRRFRIDDGDRRLKGEDDDDDDDDDDEARDLARGRGRHDGGKPKKHKNKGKHGRGH